MSSWSLSPAGQRRVHTPSGEGPAPCRALQLDPITPEPAALLCASGALFVSEDGGETWGRRSLVERAVAIDLVDASRGYLLARTSRCGTGLLVFATTDGGMNYTGRGCVDVPADAPVLGARLRQLQL